MRVTINYPSMTLSLFREILEMAFEKRMPRNAIAYKLDVDVQYVHDVVKQSKREIVYDKIMLRDRMVRDKESVGSYDMLRSLTGINQATFNKIVSLQDNFYDSVLFKMLERYDIDYEVKFSYVAPKHKKSRRGVTPQSKKIEKKKDKIVDNFEDLVEKGSVDEIMLNTELIQNYREQIVHILKVKGVGIETINRILEKADSMSRESVLLALHTERAGKGLQLEKSIIKKMNKGEQ